jgi:hypothetical protein
MEPLIIRCKACGGFLDRVLRHTGESEHQQHCRHCNHDNIYALSGMTIVSHEAVKVTRATPVQDRRATTWVQ